MKHNESRNPKSWKEPVVTRSKAQAVEMVRDFRERIAKSADVGSAFANLVAATATPQ